MNSSILTFWTEVKKTESQDVETANYSMLTLLIYVSSMDGVSESAELGDSFPSRLSCEAVTHTPGQLLCCWGRN